MVEPRRGPSFMIGVALVVSLLVFAIGYVWLQGISQALSAAAPAGCASGSPVRIQGGPGSADADEVSGLVTGWHAYTRQNNGSLTLTPADGCHSVKPPIDEKAKTRARSGQSVAVSWIQLDQRWFTPAYVLLLTMVLVYIAYNQAIEDDEKNIFLRGIQRVVRVRWKRAGTSKLPWPWIGLIIAGAVMDELENTRMHTSLDRWWKTLDDTGALKLTRADLRPIHIFSWCKLGLLLLPALLAALAAVHLIAVAAGALWRSLRKLWVQLTATILFVLLAHIAQGTDAIRRLSRSQWLVTVPIILLFGVVLVLTGSGLLKPSKRAPKQPDEVGFWGAMLPASIVCVIAALVIAAGKVVDRKGFAVLGYLLLVVGVGSLLLDVNSYLTTKNERPGNERDRSSTALKPVPRTAVELPLPHPEEGELAKVASMLIGILLAGFGLATIAATAGDLAVLVRPAQPLWWRMVIGIGLVILAVPVVLVMRIFARPERWTSDKPKVWVLAILSVIVVVLGGMLHDSGASLSFAPSLGTLNVVAIFLATFCLIGSVADHVSNALVGVIPNGDRLAVPSLLRVIGFKGDHSPIVGVLVIWTLLATTVDYSHRYDVRQLSNDATARPQQLSIDAAVTDWQNHQAPDEQRPLLFIAAAGGGIRAAYWTAAVVTCIVEMQPDAEGPCGTPLKDSTVLEARRRALFALSGASGGSVGLLSYVAAVGSQWDDGSAAQALSLQWVDERLGDDFLAAPLASYVFNDALDSLLRPQHGVDRAAVLERAWERQWGKGGYLSEPFYAKQTSGNQPYLLMNGTNVANGCRVLVSPIKTQVEQDAHFCDRSGQLPKDAANPDGSADDNAGSTIDFVNQLCAKCDIRFSTAALLSARFPLITPAGRVDSAAEGTSIDVVDGGYRDNSGASTLVDIWPAVAEQFMPDSKMGCVTPIFLQVDNGYSSDAAGARVPSTLNQLLAPAQAELKISNGLEKAARQESQQLFESKGLADNWFRAATVAHPGSSAPLGWVLSSDARDDLKAQLRLNASTINAVRSLLDAKVACTTGT